MKSKTNRVLPRHHRKDQKEIEGYLKQQQAKEWAKMTQRLLRLWEKVEKSQPKKKRKKKS